MSFTHISGLVAGLPEVREWPELAAIFERAGSGPRPDWELPVLACRASGGKHSDAMHLAAAVACLQLSIMLVDDILDDDARGAHRVHGYGPTANMALAYQTLASRLIDAAPLSSHRKLAIVTALNEVGLQTAVGQHLDVQNLPGQSNYWRVVAAKSTPFYGGALKVGAIAGGAFPQLASQMYDLGVIFGEIIQIEDDLNDALDTPANADWQQGRNNLLILYARSTDHPDRDRFEELIPTVRNEDEEALAEAQRILVSSGAVSYCVYLLISRYRAANRTVAGMKLVDPQPMTDLLRDFADSLLPLLRLAGADLSREDLLA